MAVLPTPNGKPEFYDGNSWFYLASENWVVNNIGAIAPCYLATSTAFTTTSYTPGTNTSTPGVGATLTDTSTTFSNLVVDGFGTTTLLTLGTRILVKNQSSAAQNGIYTLTRLADGTSTHWQLTRATDFDSASQMVMGKPITVINGTANGRTNWILTSSVVTVGQDAANFSSIINQGGGSSGGVTSVTGAINQLKTTTSVSGAVTVGFVDAPTIPGNVVFSSHGAITLPCGNGTSDRPTSPVKGMIRWNTGSS